VGTKFRGLFSFNGSEWTAYNRANSLLPGNEVTDLFFDTHENLWIGTTNGLAIYNPEGIHFGIPEIPTDFTLYQNHPNPFNQNTMILFTVPEQSRVKIAVFDVLGRESAVLADGIYEPGRHSIAWNGIDFAGTYMPSGVYIYRMITESEVLTKKLILLR
jgi:hypothetical protein